MRGWYSRGYLPHFDEPGRVQFITYRLHDSMPKEVLDAYNEALRRKEIDELERMRKIERYLDKGHGACWLRQPEVAELIDENILHFDGERYRLIAWCVMPNHVHVLVETVAGFSLEDLASSWKSYTAHEANRRIGRRGTFWQREVFDRYMRSEAHFNRTLFYIHWNPVQANLVDRPIDWSKIHKKLRVAPDVISYMHSWSAASPAASRATGARTNRQRSRPVLQSTQTNKERGYVRTT